MTTKNQIFFLLCFLLSLTPFFTTPSLCEAHISKYLPAMYLVRLKNQMPFRQRRLVTDRYTKICPSDFPSGTFTVECYVGRTDVAVSFSVNGAWVHTETRAPYFIGGKKHSGVVYKWADYPKKALVSCWAVGGTKPEKKVRAMLYFSCKNVGSSGNEKNKATPSAIAKKSKPTKSPNPSPTPTATPVPVSAVDDLFLSEYDTIPSNPDPTSTTDIQLTQAQIDEGCIVLNPLQLRANTNIPPGWTIDEDRSSLTFRRSDTKTSITPAGLQPLFYTIKPYKTSRYAIVFDMTTSGKADYNDVWLRFTPGGLQGMLKRVPMKFIGWVKGYHNRNGRAALLFTVDFKPHDISTGAILQKDRLYSLGIAGRSSMVTLHHIVIFPCADYGCQSWYWKKTLLKCLPEAVVE